MNEMNNIEMVALMLLVAGIVIGGLIALLVIRHKMLNNTSPVSVIVTPPPPPPPPEQLKIGLAYNPNKLNDPIISAFIEFSQRGIGKEKLCKKESLDIIHAQTNTVLLSLKDVSIKDMIASISVQKQLLISADADTKNLMLSIDALGALLLEKCCDQNGVLIPLKVNNLIDELYKMVCSSAPSTSGYIGVLLSSPNNSDAFQIAKAVQNVVKELQSIISCSGGKGLVIDKQDCPIQPDVFQWMQQADSVQFASLLSDNVCLPGTNVTDDTP